MGFATQTHIRGQSGLAQEWLAIVTELDRRGALAAAGAAALLDLGQQCAGPAPATPRLPANPAADDDA